MGFSLKLFFEELQSIIDNREIDEQDMLSQLQDAIQRGKEYAKECGQLKDY